MGLNRPLLIGPTLIRLPIADGFSRITKKTFGLYVTPTNSPVQPERFTGYHTGTDFETTLSETSADVVVRAACSGPVRLARWVSGYGGVVVQSCVLGSQSVTVLYGHLRITSVTVRIGSGLNAGQSFAVLGRGYSQETDGERKHLHFAIHRGTTIDLRGYVQKKSDLNQWIDPMSFF